MPLWCSLTIRVSLLRLLSVWLRARVWWLKPICLPLPALLLQDGRSGTIGTRGTGGEEKGYDDSSDESEILSSDDDENVETVRACAVRRN